MKLPLHRHVPSMPATDEDKEKYADETASLSKSAKKSSVTNSPLADWLFTQTEKPVSNGH